MTIRKAIPADLEEITAILNQAINWGKATAIRETLTSNGRIKWYNTHDTDLYKVFVAEEKSKIIGYLSIGPYRRGRQAFSHTAEVSYFVDFNFHRKGIASHLMASAFQHCHQQQIKNLIAFLMADNEPSINFMKSIGFELWGLFPKTLSIDGQEYDHAIYGKRIKE